MDNNTILVAISYVLVITLTLFGIWACIDAYIKNKPKKFKYYYSWDIPKRRASGGGSNNDTKEQVLMRLSKKWDVDCKDIQLHREVL